MTEINRLKATILLRELEDQVREQQKNGKVNWTDNEIQTFKSKQNTLTKIIKEGKGEYDETAY